MCLAFFFSWNNIPIYIVCVWKGDWVKWKQEIHSCLPLRISVTINTKFLEFSDDRGGGGFPLKLKLIGDYWKWMICPRAQHKDNKLLLIELSNFQLFRQLFSWRVWNLWYVRPGRKEERRDSSLNRENAARQDDCQVNIWTSKDARISNSETISNYETPQKGNHMNCNVQHRWQSNWTKLNYILQKAKGQPKQRQNQFLVKIFDSKRMGESRNMIAGLYDLEETIGEGHYAVVKLAR